MAPWVLAISVKIESGIPGHSDSGPIKNKAGPFYL